MANHNFGRRQTSLLTRLVVFLVVMVVGGAGTFASLWAAGYVDLSFLRAGTVDHGDKVQVLLSGVAIPAYTRITRDHLINPATKQAASFWLAKEQVPPGAITELSEVAGRVLRSDKAAGYFFTEDDFFPKGTRPGLVAGTPPGKRAITLDATKIQGVAGLKAGDRFDLVASLAIEQRSHAGAPKSLFQSAGATGRTGPAKEASVRLVVDNGAVVLPVYVRAVPSTTHSLANGAQTSTKPVQEIVLAIEPHEVPALTAAIAVGSELIAVARSGLPNDDHQSRISTEAEEAPKFQMIDMIVGKRREQISVPLPNHD